MSAPSPAEISHVLSTSVADPTTVTQLESYVRAQVNALYGPTAAGGAAEPSHPYNFEANRALTKLYQFFPHLADESCTALVLLLALLEYPSTDFMALSYLIPERVQEREPCATLKRCSDLLEQSQFSAFWVTFRELVINDSASEELKMATASPAAVAKVRTNVLDLLGLTYKVVAPIDAVLSALDLKDAAALRAYVNGDAAAKKMVENVGDDKVVFVSREENTKKSRVFKEAVGLDQISAALAKGVHTSGQ
jgi:translation initiation factor 3 subunit K